MVFAYRCCISLLLSFVFAPINFAGSGMSCLSKPVSVEDLEYQDWKLLVQMIENDEYEKVKNLLRQNPKLCSNSWRTLLFAKNVTMAMLLKQFGYDKFPLCYGYLLLFNTLSSPDHTIELMSYYMQNGADPNYIVSDDWLSHRGQFVPKGSREKISKNHHE